MVPLYTDYAAGGTYGDIDDLVRVNLDRNDPDAGRGQSSLRMTWDGSGENDYFQFGIGLGIANRPRDIPEFGMPGEPLTQDGSCPVTCKGISQPVWKAPLINPVVGVGKGGVTSGRWERWHWQ